MPIPNLRRLTRTLVSGAAACLFSLAAIGAPIDTQQAQQIATDFFKNPGISQRRINANNTGVALTPAFTKTSDFTPLFYIFNDAEGFIIVSADDKFPAVLGYSESGQFDENRIPENMKNWLDGYASQMKHYLPILPDGFGQLNSQLRVKRAPISPMLTTKWNQDVPYNLLCPVDRYGQAVTGCVATAYAQIMKYHAWPKNPVGENDDVQFEGTTYQWNRMIDEYNQGEYTSSQATAVATLMYQCGVAVNMQYSSWSSGAYSSDVPVAMTKYFLYDPGITMLWKDYIPQTKWNDTVYQELAAGRPVYYSGSSNQGGHAFVCDGYSENEYFHFNWGWGGYEDGYFLLSALNPASGGIGSFEDGYTSNQSIIIGIKPGTTSSTPTQQGLLCSGSFVHTSGSQFEIKDGAVGNLIYNPFGYSVYVQPGVKIESMDDPSNITYRDCGSAVELKPNYGFASLTVNSLANLKDGEYRLSPAYRLPQEGPDWIDMPIPIGKQNYVKLTVSKGNLSYANEGPDASSTPRLIFGTPETITSPIGGIPMAIRFPVVNVGEGDFNDELGFTLMDMDDDFGDAASVMDTYNVPAGTSANIDITFDEILDPARYEVSILDMKGNSYLDNYEIVLRPADLTEPTTEITASGLTPCFFTEGKASPLYFSIYNESQNSVRTSFTFQVLDPGTLEIVKTLPVSYTVNTPAGYSGRVAVRPTDLEMDPGEYYWRVADPEGNPMSLPSPMIVNSAVKYENGIAFVETSRARKEAVIVAPEGEPYNGNIELPSTIAGLNVVALRNNAFTFAATPNVTLPATINRLDPGTFYSDLTLRNFISESTEIIPYKSNIFPEKLNNIWLNVDQSIIRDWHSLDGWKSMNTPAWYFKLDNVNIASGVEINPATSEPYSPYRMNFATPLSVRFSAPDGMNVEIILIVDRVWLMQAVVDPLTYTLELPALGFNTVGEVRLSATYSDVGVDGIEYDATALFDVYSIDGRCILTNATKEDMLHLPKGIYIANGKKILIK